MVGLRKPSVERKRITNENWENFLSEFSSSDSWVILSPIEQSIKRKIEAVGTPLKDWGINIYRGVLTGYNEAFIISTEKRDEILANCQAEDERKRTAELIRPNKSFLRILSSMDDNFTSIMSFINDKICIFATVFSISTKRI